MVHGTSRFCAASFALALCGCLESTVTTGESVASEAAVRPLGWTEESHGKNADPAYDSVFRQDRVDVVTLELTDSAYKAMWDDMTALAGAFGTGTNGGGQIPTGGGAPTGTGFPQGMLDAAAGKVAGDSCAVTMNGMATKGLVQSMAGTLVCMAGPGGGAPPDSAGTGIGGPGIPTDSVNAGAGAAMGDQATELLARTPIYVPADLKMGGRTWWKVGLRLKGNSSLVSTWSSGSKKLPLRLDIDHFEDLYPEIKNERVWGFQKLSFNNANNDSSLLRERLASDIFRDFGVPTPRESFVKVLLKHGATTDTLGLYTMVEIPDKPFLKTVFGSSSGNLYKPEGTGARFATMIDSTFLCDESDISDVRSMVYALHANRTDTAAWRSGLEKTFDMDGYLKWLATNTLVRNWDAYGQMAHNFFLYGTDGRLHWITWDVGLSFQNSNQMSSSVWLQSVDSTWPLIHLVLRDSKYRAAYRANLETQLAGGFTEAAVSAKLDRWSALVEPALTPAESGGFAAAVANLKSFVRDRIQEVRTELSTN